MRRIEIEAKEAFYTGTKFKKGNVCIEIINWVETKISKYYLHGNLIAEYVHATKTLKLDDCGWQSNTTKGRLNSLLPNGTYINQKDWAWFITINGTTEQWKSLKTIQL